ncbi:MAG: tetratricopeptide repeat protein [Ignavibacteria bacterium]|nr:tetratricopeptide repeat protein [Ignavibacteria bacterium]
MKSKKFKSKKRNEKGKDEKRSSFFSKNEWLWLVIIILVSFVANYPTLNNGFTNWDDNKYVVENKLITELNSENLKTIFTTPFMGNYHPLTVLSLAVDYSLGEIEPFVYHLNNLLLHLANTILVFLIIKILFKNLILAIIVALIFGIHPLHVESIAWVSERKDVLYSLFYLTATFFYVKYAETLRIKFYILTLLFFLLSLLSKGQAVSFSVTIIAIDFLLKRKLIDKRVLFEKIPFFVLSIVFGIVAIYSQQTSEAMDIIVQYTFLQRILFASYGFIQYLIKLIIPINLSAFYPYPENVESGLHWIFYLAPILVIVLTALSIYSIKYSNKIFFGFAFFVINIFLVLQLIPVGGAIMADRYVYIPSIGFFLLIGLLVIYLLEKFSKSKLLIYSIFGIYLLIIGIINYNRTQIWKDSLTLWNDVLEKYPKVHVALTNRGNVYGRELKMLDRALEDYNNSIKYNPTYPIAYCNRAIVYGMKGKSDLALADLNKALELKPNYLEALQNRGIAYAQLGKFDKALNDFNEALKMDASNYSSYMNRAIAYFELGDYTKAIDDFTSALLIKPNDKTAFYRRSLCYYRMANFQKAFEDAQSALQAGYNIDQIYLNSLKSYLNNFK